MASAIMVFSHLRWDCIQQRPQHVLSRLARHTPVVFIEEPQYHRHPASFCLHSPRPNVLVCAPRTPLERPGFHDDQLPHLRVLLRRLLHDLETPGAPTPGASIAWFSTPMALPLLQELQPRLVVYDCIEAPARDASRLALQRENGLLNAADIVFAAGPGLYRSRRDRHPNVHCIPGSVDAAHFKPALERANSHPAHRDIPGPRLGYYGVIDDRIDTGLIGRLADAHPQWQLVLVGPVAGIDPHVLPRRANIHYLGPQPYDALPRFLAGWDVCLLPYALNDATRLLCPAETLEYMAAELPVVSTPLADVAQEYGDIVAIAADAQAFIAACEEALLAPPEVHAARVDKMRRVLAFTSWDATAARMRELIEATPPRRHRSAASGEPPADIAARVVRARRADAAGFATG